MKKIITVLAAAALASSLAFADGLKLSFYNKLYQEDAILDHYDNGEDDDGDSETVTDFPALKERMFVEVKSDRVDAMVKATFKFDDLDGSHFGFVGSYVNDWYVEFRPVEVLSLGMHDQIYSDGSYLPVYDDNLWAGNIGSNGFTVAFKPIENLRIAATVPFSTIASEEDSPNENYLNGKKEKNEDEEFDTGIGAIFDHELFQIGASIQDILDGDDRQVGAYINMPNLFGAVEGLTVGAGFAASERPRESFGDLISVGHIEGGVSYENLLSAYATIELGKFSLSAEMLYNLGYKHDVKDAGWDAVHNRKLYTAVGYDFYTGAAISFGLVDKLTATVTGKLMLDLASDADDEADLMTSGAFAIDYELNERNTLGAEFDVGICDSDWAVAIPVYWKYHF